MGMLEHISTANASGNMSSPSALGKHSDAEYGYQPDSYETSYIVRRQKRCNFCGHILNHPTKFTFAVKC